MDANPLVSFRLQLAILAVCLWAAASPGLAHARLTADRAASFEDLLREMSVGPGNACEKGEADFSRLETDLFDQADEAVLLGLNETAPPASPSRSRPKDRAVRALTLLEHASAEINEDWAEVDRFHFEVLEAPPALVVKMSYRIRATFTVFGIPDSTDGQTPNTAWKAVRALDDKRFEASYGYEWLNLFPLLHGPSNRARFLARFGSSGCGSGDGVFYYAYEWNPEDFGNLHEFLKLEGAVSREDPTSSFPPIGWLRTSGTLITLPYCWYSQIDTWDNPSLCAVDSYDISRDRARFVGRVFNRPDLVAVAKAMEYGQARDYPAVLGYCASPRVALKILKEVPPYVYAGPALGIRRIDAVTERVELGHDDVFQLQFDVKRRAGRWLVTGFRIQ